MATKPATNFTTSTTLMDYMFTGNTTGAFRKITVENAASELFDEMGLGDSSTYDVGISGGVLVGNISGEGVMRYTAGNGIHTEPENTAFNKNFGGTGSASTVARSDHGHDGLSAINNVHCLTSRFTGSTSKTFTYTQVEGYMNYVPSLAISPALNIEVFEFTDPQYIMLDKSSYTVNITVREHETDRISLNTVIIGGLDSAETYMINIIFKDDNGFNVGSGS